MRIEPYLAECRDLVVEEIRSLTPSDSRWTGGLYALVLDYPLRGAKALRPALCLKPGRADLERLVDALEKLLQGGPAGVESAAQAALAGGNDRL